MKKFLILTVVLFCDFILCLNCFNVFGENQVFQKHSIFDLGIFDLITVLYLGAFIIIGPIYLIKSLFK